MNESRGYLILGQVGEYEAAIRRPHQMTDAPPSIIALSRELNVVRHLPAACDCLSHTESFNRLDHQQIVASGSDDPRSLPLAYRVDDLRI
jgi:hypothetical protein